MAGTGRRVVALAWAGLLLAGCPGGGGGSGGGPPGSTTFTISGSVGGDVRAGVTVTLSGAASATTTTAADGSWSFGGLAAGTYTLTASRTGYTFAPPSISVVVSDADVAGQGFTATAVGATTYGISGTVSGAAEVTITLSGAGSATTTTDGSGAFSFGGQPYGSGYTVTPSKPGYAFSPPSRTVNLLGLSAVGQDFTATWVGFAISGNVAGAPSVAVALSGDATRSTTTDLSGNYSFTGLSNGSYVVTPSKTDYAFTPASRNVAVADASATGQDFAGTYLTYSVSGTVSGAPASGVGVAASGRATRSTTTDASGTFTISGLPNGSYTVTPFKAGWTFEPASRSVTIADGDLSGLTFAATWVGFTISGTVSGASGVTVSLTGTASATTTTDAGGSYRFDGLSNGTYTITPSKPGWAFTPASRTVSVYLGSPGPQDFTATPIATGISGAVSGATQSGVTIALSGAASRTTATDAAGDFAFTGLANGSYTLTPSKPGYAFTPASRTVTLAGTAVLGQDFAAAWVGLTIGGKVAGASSVTVTLSGLASGTTTTDANGMYAFTGLENGTYTVSASKPGAAIWPASITVTLNGNDALWQNFTASYQASGNVSGAIREGVTVSLKQDFYNAGSATTDASGNFSFTGLGNVTYVATPSKPGYAFTPASRTFTVSEANVTGLDFVSVPTFRISGIIDGLVEKPVTVVATGPIEATAQSASYFQAPYTLTDLPVGTYAVAPWKDGHYAFLPPSRSVTLVAADVTGQDFEGIDADLALWPMTGLLLPNTAYTLDSPAAGIATDKTTGLQWQRSVDSNAYTWDDAQLLCRSLGLGGLAGWRLPTMIELTSIVAYGSSPAVNTTAFGTNAPGIFWSSSTPWALYDSPDAYYVAFTNGHISTTLKTGTYRVRCVRNPAPNEPPYPPGRYTTSVGTVTDNATGLVWQRTLDTTNPDAACTWAPAQTHCQDKYGRPWRLPTVKELQTLVMVANAGRDPYPAIDGNAFPDTPLEYFWTSTQDASDTTKAYLVNFARGGNAIWPKDIYSFCPWIRCVQ